ncbi:hypothetical protein ACFL6W_05010 [Thermodesulfobacteriota bacterium]
MLPKRLLFGTLFLTALVVIAGCATTGKPEADPSIQYRNASDECIRCGHRRGSYYFNRCIEKILKSGGNTPAEVN